MLPPIPPDLDSEEKSLWTGWYSTGDREIVREAAVKGTVRLALKFLAVRRDLDKADVERWLKSEVIITTIKLSLYLITHFFNCRF